MIFCLILQFTLAGMYYSGYGVEQNLETSYILYQIASENGLIQSFNALGKLHFIFFCSRITCNFKTLDLLAADVNKTFFYKNKTSFLFEYKLSIKDKKLRTCQEFDNLKHNFFFNKFRQF